jgi:hypothetical protein
MTRDESRVTGWWVFAAILLAIGGTLNIIWGIAAIDNATFFTENAKFIISDLKLWGWVAIIIGAVEWAAAVSLLNGGGFGRVIGIFAAALSAIHALLSIPGNPWWSLAIFALAIIVLYELAKPRERAAM